MSEREQERGRKKAYERASTKLKKLHQTHHCGPRVDPLGVVDEAVLGCHQLGLDGRLGDVLFE